MKGKQAGVVETASMAQYWNSPCCEHHAAEKVNTAQMRLAAVENKPPLSRATTLNSPSVLGVCVCAALVIHEVTSN